LTLTGGRLKYVGGAWEPVPESLIPEYGGGAGQLQSRSKRSWSALCRLALSRLIIR